MISTWKRILLVFIAVVVFCILYIRSNDSKLFHEIPSIGTTTMTPGSNYSKTERSSVTVSHEEKLKKRFPNAIIIGEKKCGTSALRDMLCSHPVIKCCSRDESNYFDGFFHRGLKWYISTMPETKENELTIEKSQYFTDPLCPKRIYDVSRNVKLILIVRNPITRVVSEYAMRITHVPEDKRQNLSIDDDILNRDGTIRSAAHVISASKYGFHYQRWLEWFDQKQMFIANGDELINNPVSVLHEVETFLNVSHYFESSMFFMNKTKGFYCWKNNSTANEPKCLRKGKGRPHPDVSNSTLNKLKEVLKQHVQTFCYLAAVKFDWCSL